MGLIYKNGISYGGGSSGGGSGSSDYEDLSNKPSINGVTLQGNKTTSDLNIQTGTTCSVQNENLIFS